MSPILRHQLGSFVLYCVAYFLVCHLWQRDVFVQVAGTAAGVTALQLDVKTPLPLSILEEALLYSRRGRCHILKAMAQEYDPSSGILQPRAQLKDTAPRVGIVRFDPNRKSHLIGPGGVVLKQLEDRFGVALDLSQEGACLLFGANKDMVKQARNSIMELVADVNVGEVYTGTVIEIKVRWLRIWFH